MYVTLTTQAFGRTNEGEEIVLYRITNNYDAYVEFINYDCAVKSIVVPDCSGVARNVCLGFDTLEEYERTQPAPGTINLVRSNKFLSHVVWSPKEQGENYALLTAELSEYGITASVRIMWVDYNRLVLDLSAGSEISMTNNISFALDDTNTL
ncbi:MAG: hypothetical protein LBS84_07790, partial [Clostridiales bacterium]|nr:hypothetical protein [Clostridiales bacterium]